MSNQNKKILSKFEWLLLLIALGILAMVLLQNRGINVIETVEKVEISEAEKNKNKKVNIRDAADNNGKDHLQSLADYFSQNRADAKSEGKKVGFDWASLVMPDDEKEYLKNKYEDKADNSSATDWLSIISSSHKTYKSVKSIFNEMGINTDKIISSDNAAKALSNPIIANSIYKKIEEDFGISAERSQSFANKRKQNLEEWTKFVEKELKNE